MTSFTKRNRRQSLQAGFERRHRWNHALLMGSTGLGGVLAGLALGAGSAWAQVAPNTLPSGGQVVAGSATINQANPSTLNINQTTNRAVINWTSFDVGSNASVNFYQPNSGAWTLNRVNGSIAPSQILGHITANGNIAVINPNGVIFGAGSRVDVNGLIATTANISNQNFMNGNMTFDQAGNPTAVVANFGDITVQEAGLVAFVAPGVQNAGTINARLGKVSLAAGQKFTLDLYGDKLVSIAADGAVTEAPVGPNGQMVAALVDNSGKIVAEGGQVQLTAKQASRLVDNAINMSGVVQAQSAYVAQNGDIVLDAGPAGNVVVSGTLDASGKGAGQTGGSITVSGKEDVRITETAKLDASGNAGGGKIKIGGDYQGKGSTPTAKRTLVATGAQVTADAINSGKGGTIIVWSDDNTMVGGILSVQGGLLSGNGGLIETSSKGDLTIAGSTDIRLNAPNGIGGEWVLDPRNITIVSSGGSAGAAGTVAGNDQFSDNAQSSNNILDSTINTALTSGSVTLQATNNITMNAGTTISNATAGRNLTLQAGNDLTINGVITLAGSFTGTANDSTAGTSFPGGGPNGDANSVGRADSNPGDIVVAGSITASAITLTVDPSTATITFNSNGPRNYNPGNISITGNLTANNNGNIVVNATSTLSAFVVSSSGVVQAQNNITINASNATLSANLVADSDNAGGGALSGSAAQVYVTNNTAQVQDGIDIAATNGTVHLASGTTWNEALSITKGLTLTGGPNSVINGTTVPGATAVLTINTAGNVDINSINFVGGGTTITNGVLVTNVGALNFHNSNISGAITGNGLKIDAATAGVTINNNTISGMTGDGVNVDPAGPVVITGNTYFNLGGDAMDVSGVTAPATITVSGNTINDVNGNGIFVHDNTVAGVLIISGNTVGNDNTNTGQGGDIGGIGIYARDNTGYTITISGNSVATGANAAVIGGAGIRIDSTLGAANSASTIAISGNSLGIGAPGPVMQGGIYVGEQNSLARVLISGNSIDHADAAGVSGITVQGPFAGGGTGLATVTGNTVTGAGSNGITFTDVLSGTISNNTILTTSVDGIRVQLNNVSSNANVTIAGNSVNNPGSNGIYINNTDADNTLTVTFGTGNTISGLGTADDGVEFDGARLAVAGNTLNDITFLTTGGWTGFFVNLVNGALFQPGQPTVIDAGNARYDVNGNGVIDANEEAFTTITGGAINSQAALDAAWAAGGVFDIAQQVESHIHDYRDDTTLGRISPMGNITVVFSPSDFGGGLLGIQTAINLTPANGFVFVNSGDYGEVEPGGSDATTPLTINKALTVIGRQGFTSAATGGRTEGGAGESILDFAALSAAVTGGVIISANSVTLRGFDILMDSDQVAGVSITGLNRTNVNVTDNFIHGNSGNGIETAGGASLVSGNFNGNSIHNIGDTGILLQLSSGASNFTLSDNRIVAGTDASDNGIQIDAVPGAGTNLTVTQNFIEGAGGNGIIVSNFNKVTITQNTIASTIASTVGGDAIRVVAPQSGSVVSNNVIATGAGNLLSVAGAGIHVLNPSGNQTIQANSIGQAGSGIWIDNAGSGTNRVSIIGNTIDGVTSAGVTVSNSSGNDITVFVGTTTIQNVQSGTGYGIDVIDSNAGGLTTLTFGSGDTIDNAANGIRFDGADTRVTGQTFGNIVIGSSVGSVAPLPGQFFIDLRNQALYGTGPAFTPLQYDVSNVTFNGVQVASLNPEFYNPSVAVDSDREVLGALEAKIHHYFDDYTLGFIRLKPNSITLDPTVGLNGVQLAITVSSTVNVDNLYLLPGTYGDPSDLLNNATLGTNGHLLIDRNIRIIGAQGPRDAVDGAEDGIFTIPGVSAKTGGRNFADPTTESILDFNLATVTGSSQGGIYISGNAGTTNSGTVALVSIDGLDIQLGVGDTFGIRIDSSVARSNISVQNSFVMGIGVPINGSAIENSPSSALLTNVTIVENSIANASVAGIAINNAVGVAVQNNSVQYMGVDGISVLNSSFSTSVSGNMVDSTGSNGIILSGRNANNASGNVTVQNNVVSNTGTAVGATGDGIHVGTSGNVFNDVLVLNNTVNAVGVGAGSIGDGIEVGYNTSNATVQGNTIANTGTIAGDAIFVHDISGSVSVTGNTIAQGANVYNNGIHVLTTYFGTVNVQSNTIGSAAFGTSIGNGVFVSDTRAGVVTIGGANSALGNTINNTGDNGVFVDLSGAGVLVQFNTIANLANVGVSPDGGNGVFVNNTTGGNVTVLRNTVGTPGGLGARAGGSYEGDGILVVGTANNVTVGATGANGNTVFWADQDGIEVRDTGLTVRVVNNSISNVGGGVFSPPLNGDGIVVSNTGTVAGAGNGNVTIQANTIATVFGNGTADDTDGLTSADGIRASNIDGNVTVRNNSVGNVGDDGIQVNNVYGFTTVFLNSVSIVGVGSGNGGDGIQVNRTGRLSSYGSTIVGGGNVDVSDNSINGTSDTGIDVDDGLTAGDAIRIAHVDGTVGASGNVIASVVGGNIANDGIQVYDVTSQVFAGFNAIGSANASIGIGTNDGDGIVVENTGSYATTLGILNSGDVAISGNSIRNVVGFAIDRDGASNATVIAGSPVDFLTAGDGVRVAFADGGINVALPTTFVSVVNSIATVGNDGIQVFYVTGQSIHGPSFVGVNIGNNLISTVGVNTTDGDGIQVSYTGRFGGGTSAVGNTIALNAVNNVIGTGIDRDDGLTAGDGIRGSYLDGTAYVSRNQVGAAGALFATLQIANTISNDGVQLWNVSGDVFVTANTIGTGASIGTATNDGDGIVIENTGTRATAFGAPGVGNVIVSGNVVSNVVNVSGVGAPALDRDGQATGGATKLTAGDGIRIAFVGGTVAVGLDASFFDGGTSVTTNSITSVNDDGIQVYDVDRTVIVSNNVINSVGVLSTMGDGIQIDRTGTAGAHDGNGSVTVQHNSITNVATGSGGVGATDTDDTLSSNDGIRVSIVDGDVLIGGAGTLSNRVINTRDDGIEVFDVERTVSVLHNSINNVGAGSNAGDGITVLNTGRYGGNTVSNSGGVTVNDNTVNNVIGNGGTLFYDTRSQGDGVRIANVDGNALFSGNTVSIAGDDGIQVYSVVGSVTGTGNTVFTIGGGGGTGGDGIQIDKTGAFADIYGAADIGDVLVSGNTVFAVVGTGIDIDDGLTAGDGIRLSQIDGDIRVLNNHIADQINGVIYNDGVQIFNVNGAGTALTNGVTVSGNTIGGASSIGGGTPDGDGVVVENTGTWGGGPQGSGSVTVSSNIIMNVVGTGAADRDVSQGQVTGRTSGDGVRTAGIDQNVLVSNNLIDPIGDDGFEAAFVSGTVLAIGNTIDSVGNGSAFGDGIQITQVGAHFTGINVASGVTVASNTITNVISTGGVDPDDGRYAGDGVRVSDVDGNVVVGGATGTVANGNTIRGISDDGIQVDMVNGEVLVSNNLVQTISTVSSEGDGIVVTNVGATFTGYGTTHNVTVITNTVTNVAGNSTDTDDGYTAGDGVRVGNVEGTVRVLSNNIATITDDGVEVINVIGPVTVASNTIATIGGSSTGDGINVSTVTGNVLVQSNTVSNVTDLDGVFVGSIVGNVLVDTNTVTSVNDDGVQVSVVSGGNVTVSSNTISTIGGSGGGDGVFVDQVTGNVLVISNTISNVADLDGIHVELVTGDVQIGDGTAAGRNFVSTVTDDGIEAMSVAGNVYVNTNSIFNTGSNGIYVHTVTVDTSIVGNRLDSIAGVGIEAQDIGRNAYANNNSLTTIGSVGIELFNIGTTVTGGSATALNNTLDTVASVGIEIFNVSGDAVANNNRLNNIDSIGIEVFNIGNTVTNTGSATVNGNSVSNTSSIGIEVFNVTLNALVNNNNVANAGSVGIEVFNIGNTINNVGSATVNGNSVNSTTSVGIEVFNVTLDAVVTANTVANTGSLGIQVFNIGNDVNNAGAATVSNNSVSNTNSTGIQVYNVRTDAIASNNTVAGAGIIGIDIFNIGNTIIGGGVTANGNSVNNVGLLGNGDGIQIANVQDLVVVSGNSIANAADRGIDISNLANGYSITNNSVTTSDVGLYVGGASTSATPGVNVITDNSFTNNTQWGLVVEAGNTDGAAVLPGDVFPTLNILLKRNTITGNGGIPDATLSQGGGVLNNNLMFILDARGNNFGGVPFTTPTHFENPNTGGAGDAVSDWVRIDLNVIVIPEIRIQPLLDNFARGPHPLTPGDVLAIGPAFDQNGNLFDPYFVNVFGTPFGLAGNPAGVVTGIGPATDYGMCALRDMWQVSSCRIAPPPAQ